MVKDLRRETKNARKAESMLSFDEESDRRESDRYDPQLVYRSSQQHQIVNTKAAPKRRVC